MSRLLHRSLASPPPPVAVSGKGMILTMADGRQIIDGSGGAAVACLGHGERRVDAAIAAQLAEVAYVHTGLFTNRAAEELAETILADEPGGLTHAYFVSSGSEGMEAAVKLARQYFLEIGQPERTRYIARRQSYHGNTLGALAAGGNMMRRAPYAPLLSDAFSHVSAAFAYRGRRDDESEAQYVDRLADELEAEFQRLGPDNVIAFCAEPVVGATTGCVAAPAGYFRKMREICDRHGALLILDEVMCGMGRTGTMHAWEQEGVTPDIQIVAKGLGGGYQPIGGILIHGRVIDAFRRGSGSFMHGHTYQAHPVACAAALAVQKVIAEDGLLANVGAMGERLATGLVERLGNHRHVGDIRGRGLFWAIELVADRASKTPFDPSVALNLAVRDAAMARGLAIYPMAGTIDGKRGDHIVIAPPYIAQAEDIDAIVARMGDAVDDALAMLPARAGLMPHAGSLAELEARLAYDLACLNHPPPNWVIPAAGPEGEAVSDVVIIGAGMAGLAAGFALIARGVRNLRILDRAEAGREGPWATFARMETLRSPKMLLGPATIPSVTFRAWHTAQFGAEAWEALYRIPRPMWMDYLNWYRRVLDLPVENGVRVTDIEPHRGLLRLHLAAGAPVLARKVVLATGRSGLGRAAIPAFARGLPKSVCAHTEDDIDFAALRGKRVAVIGAGASAVDNAAEALEHGAAEARLLIRRKTMPLVNKFKGIGSAGFTSGFPDMSDAWRWRFMHYAGVVATPAPRNSTLRVSRHRNAFFHFDTAVRSVAWADNRLVIETTRRRFEADFLILGTGFTVEPDIVPEIARFAPDIARWSDIYAPPPEFADPELATFPYLAPDFAFVSRGAPVRAMADLHCFNHAASLSLGKIAGDIPKIADGAVRLAEAIASSLFVRDAAGYFQQAQDYDVPELHGDEWTDAEASVADPTPILQES